MSASAVPGRVDDQERLARVALGRLTEPGDPRLLDLVAELGACRLRDALVEQRQAGDLGGLGIDAAGRVGDCDPEADLERADRLGIRFVVPGDDEWPVSLEDLRRVPPLHARGGPPLGLWVRGPLDLRELGSSVAVVGSRSATTYGTEVATDVAVALARSGRAVVSGAAFGIDQAAHRGAFVGQGPTAAVLACGADRDYPKAHRQLLASIAAEGAVVSEVPLDGEPMRIRFLARNRLIAALSQGTVVVEAAVRSGALNTSTWAERLRRVVMGVPGPVTSVQSEGVHQLLRRGEAGLVTSGADVLELMGAAGECLVPEPRAAPTRRDRLTARERQVLDGVPAAGPVPTDEVARGAGMGLVEVGSALRRLVAAGLVETAPEGWRLTVAARDDLR